MSKFKGKLPKKKEFDGERNSFDKDRPERRNSVKSKDGKYRKKNFRDFGSGSDDEYSRRSALKDETTPKKGSGRPGIGKEPHRNSRQERSEERGHRSGETRSGEKFSRESRGTRSGENRSGGSRTGNFRNRESGNEKKRGTESRTGDKAENSRNKSSVKPSGPKQEPPTYDSFSFLNTKEGKEKVSAEERHIRLNKFIADAGVCSRREADKLIEAGEIKVNGEVITELGYKVSRKDVVTYNGKKLKQEKLVYVLLNKPKNFITTVDDPDERRTVMQLVDNAADERIYPVGRLDRNTTGLLLLTNDGELAKKLTHPSHNIKKIYQVDLDKPLTEEDFEKIKEGITLEDGPAKVDEIAILSEDRSIVGLEIHIGRNRIVRRIFEHLGYEVVRLDRVMFAGLTKKDLPRGKWRYLSEKELIRLKHFK